MKFISYTNRRNYRYFDRTVSSLREDLESNHNVRQRLGSVSVDRQFEFLEMLEPANCDFWGKYTLPPSALGLGKIAVVISEPHKHVTIDKEVVYRTSDYQFSIAEAMKEFQYANTAKHGLNGMGIRDYMHRSDDDKDFVANTADIGGSVATMGLNAGYFDPIDGREMMTFMQYLPTMILIEGEKYGGKNTLLHEVVHIAQNMKTPFFEGESSSFERTIDIKVAKSELEACRDGAEYAFATGETKHNFIQCAVELSRQLYGNKSLSDEVSPFEPTAELLKQMHRLNLIGALGGIADRYRKEGTMCIQQAS